MRTRDISNSDDVIDSRDVIARIEQLEDERQGLVDDLDDAQTSAAEDDDNAELADALEAATSALEDFDDSDEGQELKALKALAEEAEGYAADWRDGATLIRDSQWVEYCRELLVDIGDLPKDLPSYIEIDWNATAENLQVDYTSVEFDGVTYWVR